MFCNVAVLGSQELELISGRSLRTFRNEMNNSKLPRSLYGYNEEISTIVTIVMAPGRSKKKAVRGHEMIEREKECLEGESNSHLRITQAMLGHFDDRYETFVLTVILSRLDEPKFRTYKYIAKFEGVCAHTHGLSIAQTSLLVPSHHSK